MATTIIASVPQPVTINQASQENAGVLCHQVVDDIGHWLLFKKRDEDLYAVGSISVDRYLVVPASKLNVTMRIIQYLDGSHDPAWIQQQMRSEFGREVKIAELFIKLRSAGLIKTAQMAPSAHSEMLRHSLRLFSFSVEGIFHHLTSMRLLFSKYLLTGGVVFIALVFALVHMPKNNPAHPVHMSYGVYTGLWIGVLAIALLHEAFHGFAGLQYGLAPTRITAALYLGFIPYAFITIPGIYTIPPFRRIVLWCAGIYANLLLAAALLLAQVHLSNDLAGLVLRSFIYINLSLVFFNLLPFMGTDSYFILSTLFKIPNIRTNAYLEFKNWIRGENHRFKGFLIVYFFLSALLIAYFASNLIVSAYVTVATVRSQGLHWQALSRAWPFALIFLSFVVRRMWDNRIRSLQNPR